MRTITGWRTKYTQEERLLGMIFGWRPKVIERIPYVLFWTAEKIDGFDEDGKFIGHTNPVAKLIVKWAYVISDALDHLSIWSYKRDRTKWKQSLRKKKRERDAKLRKLYQQANVVEPWPDDEGEAR